MLLYCGSGGTLNCLFLDPFELPPIRCPFARFKHIVTIPVFLLRISSVTPVCSQNPFRTRFVAPVPLDASSPVYSVAFFPHHSLRPSHIFLAVLIVPFESSDISNTNATTGRRIGLLIRGWR